MTSFMYDSIEYNVPGNAPAVAGYTGGFWPTYYGFLKRFPHLAAQGRVVPIAINKYEKGRFLDIERGDAVPGEFPYWFEHNADRSHGPAGFYASGSALSSVLDVAASAGIHRAELVVWSAHYGQQHICGPHTCGYPQADGTQFNDHALGENLDESVLGDSFFPAAAPLYPIDRFITRPLAPPSAWLVKGAHPRLARFNPVIERNVVAAYRQLVKDPAHNRAELWVLRQVLLFCRKHVWWAAQAEKINGRWSWGLYWRGWRYQQLWEMTKGVQPAW